MHVGHDHDFAQPYIQPTNAVARADHQPVSDAGIRRLEWNVADDVQFMLPPSAAQFAQRRLAHAPAEDVPRADMAVRLFQLIPSSWSDSTDWFQMFDPAGAGHALSSSWANVFTGG